jgi:hypothetical protein
LKSKKEQEFELLSGTGFTVDTITFGKIEKNTVALLQKYINSPREEGLPAYKNEKITKIEGWKEISALKNHQIIQGIKLSVAQLDALGHKNWLSPNLLDNHSQEAKRLVLLIKSLLRRKRSFSDDDFLFIFTCWLKKTWHGIPYTSVLNQLSSYKENHHISNELFDVLNALVKKFSDEIKFSEHYDPKLKKLIAEFKTVISDDDATSIFGDEKYSRKKYIDVLRDAYVSFYETLDTREKRSWKMVFKHARLATGSKPSKKWLTLMDDAMKPVGGKAYVDAVVGLMEASKAQKLVWLDYNHLYYDHDASTMLRGLVWGLLNVDYQDILSMLGEMCAYWYTKERQFGARSSKLGNACLYVLASFSEPETLSVLSHLKNKIKYSQGQKIVQKYLEQAAGKLGVSSDELEDIIAPDFSFNQEGAYQQKFDDHTFHFKADGTGKFTKFWQDATGKKLKRDPAEVKASHPEALKQLKQKIKSIPQVYTSQKRRIEKHYLTGHAMPYRHWLERYARKGFINTISHRLIWQFDVNGHPQPGLWHEGRVVDHQLNPLKGLGDTTSVRLWHPIYSTPDEVLGWRDVLDQLNIQQPFKQAYREVYLLTEAERETSNHSLRFAGHILKQSQVAALAKDRGWTCTFEGSWDSQFYLGKQVDGQDYFVEIMESGLANELQITSDTGIYPYIGTEKIVFRKNGNDHQLLEEIPKIVFSEMLRDIDLFVSVAGIANDADLEILNEARLFSYVQSYSSEALRETGQSRKAALQKIITRLKIADRCTFDDRYIHIKGDLNSYKIHIGSGNVLLEPENRHICIVENRSIKQESYLLPFEGDFMLSLIISKVQLLANDKKIKSSSIISQIT